MMDNWKPTTISLNEIKYKITSFEKELLVMFPTIKFVDEYHYLKPLSEPCGYMPRKHQILMTYDLPRVSHEISHMVEMNDLNRLIIDDWGLYFKDELHGKSPFDNCKFAFRAAAREARVKGIENHICKSEYQGNRILADTWYRHRLYPHVGFGRFSSKEDIDDWLRSIFETTRKQWSLDRIQHEWKQRVEFIRNWQESKGV